ncbi:MAG: hypothetical protein FJZ92_11195 [Chloroflexi bacterium]|nr:hypothetical protein [Chloroflexota bacterium]
MTAGAALALLLAAAAPAAALERLPAVLHVHSNFSTGTDTLDGLATVAQEQGVGALLLSENYLLRIEYGLPPFRALTRVVHEERSVLDRLESYFARVAEARRRFPGIVFVPGVEVMPHYHWSGNPLALDLRIRDSQKNLLLFGIDDAEVLRRLPVTGNPGARAFQARALIEALPALLIVPGLVVLLRPRRRRIRLGAAVIVQRQRRWLLGGTLVLIGVVSVVRGWPFTVDRYPPWRDFGLDPHQEIIDAVEARGGAVVWSFPEARDGGERFFGPARVSWGTAPYADDLLATSNYTAFGAVYEQPTTFARPGGGWDRLLTQYAAGERARPVWGVGESGYHQAARGKRIGPIQTVFLVESRTEAAVLDALKRGRMYAVRTSEVGLVLAELVVASAAGAATMGETLPAPAGTPLELRASIDATRAPGRVVRVTLVKNGQVAETWSGPAPLRIVHRDVADGRRSVYRLEARVSAGDHLLSNPVFVAP